MDIASAHPDTSGEAHRFADYACAACFCIAPVSTTIAFALIRLVRSGSAARHTGTA